MATVFEKLNLKQQSPIAIVNAPASFEREIASLKGVDVRRSLGDVPAVEFALAFVTDQKEVDAIAKIIAKKASGDAIVWFAYPKGTSKKLTSTISRDKGWTALGRAGFEGVRLIAIDEDWSAVRFRRAEFIKSLTRDKAWAMREAGTKKAGAGRERRTKN